MDWFHSNTMSLDAMETVEGWIDALQNEFEVNTAVARERAKARKYNPDVDKSVMDYFYSKVNLEKTTNPRIRTQDLVDEIWLGLPDEFQVLFNHRALRNCSLSELGRVFADKDPSFHATWRNQRLRRDSRRDDRTFDHRSDDKRRDDRCITFSNREGDRDKNTSSTKKLAKDKKFNSSKRSTSKKPTEPPTPAPLPRDQWKTDAKGRTMTRTCRYCNKWHYDFDCPKCPASYNLSYTMDQFPPKPVHESDSETTSSDPDTSSSAYSS